MAGTNRRFRHVRNESFTCMNCGETVAPLACGGCRNHCPRCLCSRHLDDVPGDRNASCGGLMECIAVEPDARRGWMLTHRCTKCGAVRRNKAAVDDPRQPDDFEQMVEVARAAPRRTLQS